ncbi:MAG: polysaccharide biosynthesis tyrosine autokinase [Pseudomonadota bacterium]
MNLRRHSAEALIRIQTTDAQVIDIPELGRVLELDSSTIQSELELITSRAFVGRVIDQLNLVNDPEFNAALRSEPTLADRVTQSVGDGVDAVKSVFGIDASTSEDDAAMEGNARARVIQHFRQRIAVQQIDKSHVLQIVFSSEDPVKAATIVDTVADTYIQVQLEAKYAATDRATSWLRARVDELREQVIAAEQRVVEFQSQEGILSESRVDPIAQQIGEINGQLATAQAARAEAQARFNQVQKLLNSNGGLGAAANVLNSTMLDQLRTMEADINRRQAELSGVFGERHPQMQTLKAEVAGIRGKQREEVQRIVSDLGNEVEVARAREIELKRSLDELKSLVQGEARSSVELRDFERDAESARQVYQLFLQRLSEVVEAQGLQEADAVVLSYAEIPLDPSYPAKKLLVILAFGASGMLGTIFVFVVERWTSDLGYRSGEEIQNELGLRALALVPDVRKRELRENGPEAYLLLKPQSAYAEAIQRVRTSLFLGDADATPKTVLLTSSMPGEGKTSLAASLARQSARSGLKTLLVDADLRRPRVHEALAMANNGGLTEVLTGDGTFDDHLKLDEPTGLKVLLAGRQASSPPDLFRSSQMKKLLTKAGEEFDLVILDSPPIAAVSDSFILAKLVDQTIFAVHWAKTPRKLVQSGLQELFAAGVRLAGVALTRVDVKKHAQYGYADSGTYAGNYVRYYVN